MRKLMMAVNRDIYRYLEEQAEKREVSIQELFRAVILPDWVKKNVHMPPAEKPPEKKDAKVVDI